jgi:GMP synthase (glutamine-hydrolysing)
MGTCAAHKRWRGSVLRDLEGFPVLHWHGDNLEAPSSTETLAVTDACPCQAFAKGSNLLGLQFHLEVDLQKIERWLIGHAVELKQSGCDPAEIRADTLRHGPVMAEIGAKVITKWLEGLQL